MKRELDTLVKSAKLVAIDLVKYRWELSHTHVGGALALPAKVETHIQIALAVPAEFSSEQVSFLCMANVRLSDPDKPEPLLGLIELHVRVAYELEGVNPPLSKEEGEEFGNVIAMHQAWPFIRERLRTASAELGLNPIILPLNKAGLEAKVRAKQQAETKADVPAKAKKTQTKRARKSAGKRG